MAFATAFRQFMDVEVSQVPDASQPERPLRRRHSPGFDSFRSVSPRLAVLAILLIACAELEAPRGPSPAEQERQRQADIVDERARMDRADREEADAAAHRQAKREARELAEKREAFTRKQAATEKAIADSAPCVLKSTETDAERARWEGARWVEANCSVYRAKPVVVCNPACIAVAPCATYMCPPDTAQEWLDLANQKLCGGVHEARRAELVDAPCVRSGSPLPGYPAQIGN